MKKVVLVFSMMCMSILLSNCSRVAPNYYGVLMENCGKNGKEDYTLVKGRVGTVAPCTELFQVPAWEQRADFGDRTLNLNASNNTAFTAKPLYSYEVVENRAVDVVFRNARFGSGEDFMRAVEDNVIEPLIYDIIKEIAKQYHTDSLMATGGNLKFERVVQAIVRDSMAVKGFRLLTFSPNLEFSKKVKDKIDTRNEVNANVTVLDQQIIEQAKINELEELRAEQNRIISSGITPQLLQQQFIDKWDGHTTLYGWEMPITLMKSVK